MVEHDPVEESVDALLSNVLDALGPVAVMSAVRGEDASIVDFRYELVNPAFCAVVHESSEVLLGARLLELFPSHVELGLFDEYRRVVDTGEPFVSELPWFDERNIKAYFEVSVTRFGDGYLMTGRDVTEAKLAEQLRDVFDAAHDAIIAADPDGNVTTWSKAAEHLYGWSAPEVLGRHLSVLVPSSLRSELAMVIDDIRAGRPVEPFETLRLRRDDSLVPVEISANPVLGVDGSVIGLSTVHREISERLRARLADEQERDRLHGLLDHVPTAIVILRAVRDANGSVVDLERTFVNRAAATLLQRPADELVGTRLWEMSPGSVGAVALDRFARVLESGERSMFDLERTDGEAVRMEVSRLGDDDVVLQALPEAATPAPRDGRLADRYLWGGTAGSSAPGSATDQFRSVLELSPVPTWMVQDPPDAAIVFANAALCRVLGVPDGSLTGRRTRDFLDPDDVAKERSRLIDLLSDPSQAWSGRIVLRRQDGTQLPTDAVFGRVVVDGHERFIGSFHDATQRVEGQRVLVESEHRFRLSFDSAPIGMALVDLDGRFLDANQSLCRFLGLPRAQLVSRTWQELTHPDDTAADERLAGELLAGERDSYDLDKRYLRPDGEIVWGRLHVSLARDVNGHPLHLVKQVLDVTRSRLAEDRLRADAATDPLTGLPNRRSIRDWVPGADLGVVAVLYVDLDGFKEVNDRHGHHVGDALLRQVAERLRGATRPGHHLARVGGDEFVVLCALAHSDDSLAVSRRLQAAMEEPIELPSGPVRIGLTIGIAVGSPGTPMETLLRDADAAMYEAKRSGRPGTGPDSA